MKTRTAKWLVMMVALALLQGCVAIPPLVQVEHKDSNEDIKRRLDSIDRRLDRLENKGAAPKSEHAQ